MHAPASSPPVPAVRYKELSPFLHIIPNVRVTSITPSVSVCVRVITDPSESRLLVSEPRRRRRCHSGSGPARTPVREREVSPVHVSGTQRGTLRHPGDIKLEDGVMSQCPPFIFDNIPFSIRKSCIFNMKSWVMSGVMSGSKCSPLTQTVRQVASTVRVSVHFSNFISSSGLPWDIYLDCRATWGVDCWCWPNVLLHFYFEK